jgi:hypothetical protein
MRESPSGIVLVSYRLWVHTPLIEIRNGIAVTSLSLIGKLSNQIRLPVLGFFFSFFEMMAFSFPCIFINDCSVQIKLNRKIK